MRVDSLLASLNLMLLSWGVCYSKFLFSLSSSFMVKCGCIVCACLILYHMSFPVRLGLNAFLFWIPLSSLGSITSSSTYTSAGPADLRIRFMRVYHCLLALAEFVDILFQLELGGLFLLGKRSH